VADRSVAMRPSTSSWAWLWVFLAVLGGLGGALYYWQARGFAPGPSAADTVASSTPRAGEPGRADSALAQAPASDTTATAPAASLPAGTDGSTPRPSAADSAADSATAQGGPTTPDVVGPIDSGGIRLIGLPRGSTVMIDEQPVTQAVTKLPPGPHALAISAPLFNFYSDTIVVRPGQIQELTPQLTKLGAPAPAPRQDQRRATVGCVPGPGYNADGSCFDERPKPVNAPFVTVPADATAPSPRPSLLWVKVSSEGRTVDLMRLRPSNDPAFEREVRNFVWTVTWHPAVKDGAPVEAWTQMLFPPARDQ
jgi:hypothetical protein